jgi:hypothetical protein
MRNRGTPLTMLFDVKNVDFGNLNEQTTCAKIWQSLTNH